jgi:hypothetical protein
MSLDAGVEAEVDLGPLVLQALVGLGASMDTLNRHLRDIAKLEEAYQFGAAQVRLSMTATSDSNGDSIEIGVGGPTYGRLWQIRSLVVGGSLWTTTVAGSALVVIGANKTLTPPLTDIVDEAGSLPSVAQYSTSQIVVRHPNHLRVVILTPTASTLYAVGGWATDMPDKRERIEASL